MHNPTMATKDDIKAARKKLGESQAAFGSRLGVNQATIHRWETFGIPERGATRVAIESVLAGLREQQECPQN